MRPDDLMGPTRHCGGDEGKKACVVVVVVSQRRNGIRSPSSREGPDGDVIILLPAFAGTCSKLCSKKIQEFMSSNDGSILTRLVVAVVVLLF